MCEYGKQVRLGDSKLLKVGWEIMKFNKKIVAILSGAALFAGAVAVVSMTSLPKAPEVAGISVANTGAPVESENSVKKPAPVILASVDSMAGPRANLEAVRAALPQSIPVPCPIWILAQLTGYSKTTVKTADGTTPNPKLVPGGIWVMQKFAAAAAKTL